MMKALTCGIRSTLFQLKFRQLLWCNNDFKISDRLCFIGFTNLFISAIGISVKSHIGATLLILYACVMYICMCVHTCIYARMYT